MRPLCLFAAAILGAGCATTVPVAEVPGALAPAASHRLATTVAARGVQVYECRAVDATPGAAAQWSFVGPEATLFDGKGRRVGHHGGGPHWTATDGSRVIGRGVAARVDAPRAGAIPWLLVNTETLGKPGAFGDVAGVQRIHTEGGVAPPAADCNPATVGRAARVPYSADYRFFIPTH
jgi:hypothetical protein